MVKVEEHIKEIERVKAAIKKSKSQSLKIQYGKYLKKLEKELGIYYKLSGVNNVKT